MILVVGGAYQGKFTFVKSMIEKGEMKAVSTEIAGPEAGPGKAFQAGIVSHLEFFIRACIRQKKDPAAFVERLFTENPEAIVIADEIGCGVVPQDDFELYYREMAGRLLQSVAAQSEAVYRVTCGIGTRIK